MSKAKSAASRANGAKSRGPVTPEGKAASARNSLRHGLTSRAVVLPGEDPEDFDALRDAYAEQFQPATQLEMDLVEAMAVARFRLRRVAIIETHLLVNKILDDSDSGPYENDDQNIADAFDQSNASIGLLTRYESSLDRTFDRALKQLQSLQKTRSARPPAELRNEPEPASPPATSPLTSMPQPAPQPASDVRRPAPEP